MKPHLGPGTRVYSVGYYDQTIPFYLGRTVTLVDYWDEFSPGLKREPELAHRHARGVRARLAAARATRWL